MKKNRGTSLTPWFEEEMNVAVNRNRNVEQNIGLRPHFFLLLIKKQIPLLKSSYTLRNH